MNLTNDYVPMGVRLLSAVSRQINETGHLGQVTDPYSFSREGDYSPEGQAFVVMAYAAYEEWDAAGREGADDSSLEDGASGRMAGVSVMGLLGACLVVAGWVVV